MKLNTQLRIELLKLVPTGTLSYVSYKIFETLKSELSFSDEEQKELEMKISEPDQQGNFNIAWNKTKDFEKEICIPEVAKNKIISILEKLDKEEMITPQNAPLYEKFVLNI